jgi:hypothetical protein
LPSNENQDRTRKTPLRPRKKRSRYYTASLVLAIVFLVLAMAFPIYLDLMRKERGAHEAMESQVTEAQTRPTPTPMPVAGPKGFTNIQCQAYVTARCNALGMGTAWCGEALTEALKLRNASSVAECKALVEKKINEAFVLYSATAQTRDVVEASVGDTLLSQGEGQSARDAWKAGLPDKGVEAQKDARQVVKQEKGEKETGKMSKQEEEKNLKEIYKLVEEIQVGALNYVTPTPMQRARFEQLRKRAEADGSEEVIRLYNDVIAKYGRTGGVGAQGAGGGSAETEVRVEAKVGENRETESRELRTVRGIMEKRGVKANEEPKEPRSIDPSEAQVQPAQGL